ncbi:MAG: hypothetical protein PF572_06475 [Patescibacteria group bacterium]|jgi:predicted transcriptional regulator of viral defense system|nr:hypothetical protein [Patescibacteria group bacterium]
MIKNLSWRLKALNNTRRTVFRTKDLQKIWGDNERTTVFTAKRMVQKELIFKLSKGYYALSEDYNHYELANTLIIPSYVSFNSALLLHGVCFQIGNDIQSVSTIHKKKRIDGKDFLYHSMKDDLFSNNEGIERRDNVILATPERAILDSFYFGYNPNIDNEDKINKTYLKRLTKLYPQTIQNKIKKYYDK